MLKGLLEKEERRKKKKEKEGEGGRGEGKLFNNKMVLNMYLINNHFLYKWFKCSEQET